MNYFRIQIVNANEGKRAPHSHGEWLIVLLFFLPWNAYFQERGHSRCGSSEEGNGRKVFWALRLQLVTRPSASAVGRKNESAWETDAGLDKTVSFDRSIRNWLATPSTVRYVGSNLDHEQFNLQFTEGRIPLSVKRASTEERRSNFSPHCARVTSRMRLRLPFL